MDEFEDGVDMQNNFVEKEEIKFIKRKGRLLKVKCESNEGCFSFKVKVGFIGYSIIII